MTFINCSKPHPHNLETWAANERAKRITRLIEDRQLSVAAAVIVVDAAMFGIGCLHPKFANQQGAQNVTDR